MTKLQKTIFNAKSRRLRMRKVRQEAPTFLWSSVKARKAAKISK